MLCVMRKLGTETGQSPNVNFLKRQDSSCPKGEDLRKIGVGNFFPEMKQGTD